MTGIPRQNILFGGVILLFWLLNPAVNAEEISSDAFKRCKACHELKSSDETIISGGKNGPNLYRIIGRRAGSLPDYTYSEDIIEAGKQGLIFDVKSLAAYASNPNLFISQYLGRDARSKMPLGFPESANEAAVFLDQFKPQSKK